MWSNGYGETDYDGPTSDTASEERYEDHDRLPWMSRAVAEGWISKPEYVPCYDRLAGKFLPPPNSKD